MARWYIIAKNEIKTRTSKFRKHRLIFFIIVYSILCVWAFVLAPYLFDLFMPTIVGIEAFAEFKRQD